MLNSYEGICDLKRTYFHNLVPLVHTIGEHNLPSKIRVLDGVVLNGGARMS